MSQPIDGQVIDKYGVYYQYNARENSWIQITGYGSIDVATINDSGLMSKEDFIKFNGLFTSPPKTTLTSDQCGTLFESGVVKFYSQNHSVFVEDYLDLYGPESTDREKWQIHEDTWGYNFRINLHYLVEEMNRRGNLISNTIIGPKGLDGDPGDPGEDKLDTGPKGEDGEDGSNAPFAGGLVNSSGMILKNKDKAVVDVDVENISQDENYLIVKKGVISPENLCTKKAFVDSTESSWVLVRDKEGIVCSNACIKNNCDDKIVYLDVDVIVNSVREYINFLILKAKEEREQWVREWVRTMMQTFNDQKYSLCCGIENCRSRKRNQDERRYIESQRIAAAGAGFNLVISSEDDGENVPEPHTKFDLDMDKYKSCEGPGWQPTIVEPINPPSGPNTAKIEVTSSESSHWKLDGVLTAGSYSHEIQEESLGGEETTLEYNIGNETSFSFDGTYWTGAIIPDRFVFKLNDTVIHDTGVVYNGGNISF